MKNIYGELFNARNSIAILVIETICAITGALVAPHVLTIENDLWCYIIGWFICGHAGRSIGIWAVSMIENAKFLKAVKMGNTFADADSTEN